MQKVVKYIKERFLNILIEMLERFILCVFNNDAMLIPEIENRDPQSPIGKTLFQFFQI
jgi:hypothetical protein